MLSASGVLGELWAASIADLRRIVDGLTDEEFRWEPRDGCWTVRHEDDGWVMDNPDDAPEPPPVTTIGWRLLHIARGNWIYGEFAFGAGSRNFADLPIYGAAGPAVDDLIASQRPITDALTLVSDVTLNDSVRTQSGRSWPAARVFSTLLREQIQHGAEISLLRELYRNRK
jgi:hypothetical protein